MLLIEELAKQLDLPKDDVNNALAELVDKIKSDLDSNQPAILPGVGTFERNDNAVAFEPTETLAMAVNNRYAALDTEMIQLGFEEPEFSLSENLQEGNDQEVDQSLIDQIIADDMNAQGLFTDSDDSNPQPNPIEGLDPFEGDLLEPALENQTSPTPDATTPETEVEPASMKEEDPNSNNPPKNDPLGSDTEWSPFFEELEGEEFDIDNTIDLSAEDWQADVPAPPPSPFASSSDSSNTNADDLYFDVDADPDDTLFAPAGSIDVENPNEEDMSWATAPLDDVTDFFEDDPSMSSSFGEEADVLSAMSAEDEFFSPVSGSANATPDDTLFAPAESIYSEDASTEADDTIFLAPDQTVQASAPADQPDAFAPPAESKAQPDAAPAPPPRSKNPYAYRDERRKKSTSSFPWVAALIGFILLTGAGVAVWQNWIPLPFGNSDAPATTATATPPPVETPPESTPANVDPQPQPATAGGETGPETTTTPTQATTPPPAPVAQRIPIDRTRGGWTVVVTSKEQRIEAARIMDNFVDLFSSSQVPVDILPTNDFDNTRYRVGVGQFSSRDAAGTFMSRSRTSLPEDAWILRIE